MAAAEGAAEVDHLLAQAEELLQRGLLDEAQQAATSALQRTADPAALGRGYAVLIQADFQVERLTDLQGALQQCGHQIQQVPLTAMMLWGVVAVEFQEADAARATMGAYLEATQGRPAGISREDAMALSRLYAVQLLAGLCQDFMAAASWLEAGGAELSHEQLELLLMEVDEAEELLQEEHLAKWASTHAAAAADGGAADPAAHNGTHADGVDADMYRDAGADADAHSNAPYDTVCSTAASLSIADSAGGLLGFQSPPFADFQNNIVTDNNGSSSEATLQGLVNGLGPSASCSEPAPQQQQQLNDTGSSRIDELATAMDAAAIAVTAACSTPAAAMQQQQHQQELPTDQPGQEAAAAAEPAVAAAAVADDNPFCTITGLIDVVEQTGPGKPGSAAEDPAAAGVAAVGTGSAAALTSAAAGAPGPPPGTCALEVGAAVDSTSTGRARDQSNGGSGSGSKVAGAVAGKVPHQGGTAAVAAAAAAAGQHGPAAAGANSQQQQQQQQQSMMGWISSSSSKLWSMPAVQGMLHALQLQDLQPYEVVGGAALAGLVGYSIYRERRAVKRVAADLVAGVVQTAQMALGFTVVNPMGAVPGTQHMLR